MPIEYDPLLNNSYDLDQIHEYLFEQAELYLPMIEYKRLTSTSLDDGDAIHQEVWEQDKKFDDPVNVRVLVRPQGQKQMLSKFGLEDSEAFIVRVCVPALIEVALASMDLVTKKVTFNIGIGDRFDYEDQTMEVLNWTRVNLWGTTQSPLFVEMAVDKYREDSSQYVS